MSLASLTQPARADRACAQKLLGPGDPLFRVLVRLTETFDQMCSAGLIVCAAAVWLAEGGPWGLELVVASVLTLLLLGGRLATLIAERNELVLGLIIRGGRELPLVAIERLRRRLLDRRTRQRLAHTIAAIRDASARPAFVGGVPVNSSVMRAVERDLADVIALLGAEHAGIRGIARAYRLLGGPASPLFGDDEQALREELHQIQFLLRAGL